MAFRGKRNLEVTAADRTRERFVLVFRINDYDVGAGHKKAQRLKFHGVTFARAGFCENHHVAVFKREAVKNNKRVIVAIDAVENAFV